MKQSADIRNIFSITKNTKKKSSQSEEPKKKSPLERLQDPKVTDRPSSYYLKPRQVGVKIKTTQAKVQSEDEVVKQCVEYLRKNGWITKTIYTGGIPTASGRYIPNPSKGIPDSINFHIGTKRMMFIEYKKSHGGIVSPEQKEWHNLLTHCGCMVLVVNSLKCLKEFLDEPIARAS